MVLKCSKTNSYISMTIFFLIKLEIFTKLSNFWEEIISNLSFFVKSNDQINNDLIDLLFFNIQNLSLFKIIRTIKYQITEHFQLKLFFQILQMLTKQLFFERYSKIKFETMFV